ncbi:MAG: tRNA 2-thiocytidine biosynthesis protein TtcA [Paludibacteraceae bacterium]|jgi:tRNA(Ile)-lysidine synthase TilS/MesJ|nr:tRNA 2-thiocytidine biosynthesis protein TtcA [Paludibacteraceae bacterium]
MAEDKLFLDKVFRKFRKTIETYGLLSDGDRILVGLSGGKDSLALLEMLGRKKLSPNPSFSLVALHVSMENIPYRADVDYLRQFAEKCGAEFVHVTTSFDPSTDKRKSPCFLCSWNRRKMMFTMAKEMKCNKIALGHHLDDVLQTLLMNLTFQGSFGTMPPLLKMSKFDMTIIRPMSQIDEEDIKKMALLHDYQKQEKNCPYEEDSHRSEMKELLTRLKEMNPNAANSMWNAMSNIQEEYLP